MNKEILEEYKELLLKHESINEEFLKRFIVDYVITNNLHNYIQDVRFDVVGKTLALYIPMLKKITLNINAIKNAMDPNMHIIDQNNSILATVIHELTHAEQKKIIIEKTADPRIIEVLRTSYSDRDKQRDVYKKFHDLFIIEYNANLNGTFKMIEYMNELGIVNKKAYATYIHNLLMNFYVFDELGVMAPIEKYEIIAHQKYEQEHEKYAHLSEFEKIVYGLPIEAKTYQKIHDLRKKKEFDPNTYLKK